MRGNRVFPILVLVGKQLIGDEVAREVELPLLLFLDGAKRGACDGWHVQHDHRAPAHGSGDLDTDEQPRAIRRGGRRLERDGKACARPTELLDLTTTEYKAIRAAVGHYVRALPLVEVQVLSYVSQVAHDELAK